MNTRLKELYESGHYSRFFAPERKDFPFAALYEEKRRIILERLDEEDRTILDLGAGRGRLAIPLGLRNRVVMADLSLKMIEEAMEALAKMREESFAPPHPEPHSGDDSDAARIDFVCCDAEYPPFADEAFDAVLAIDLLPHVGSQLECLKHIHRLLKPGGTAIVDNSNSAPWWMFAFPDYVNWKRHPLKFLRTFLKGGILPNWADRITHLSKEEFVECLRRSGLVTIDFLELGPSYCPKWHVAFCRKPSR